MLKVEGDCMVAEMYPKAPSRARRGALEIVEIGGRI